MNYTANYNTSCVHTSTRTQRTGDAIDGNILATQLNLAQPSVNVAIPVSTQKKTQNETRSTKLQWFILRSWLFMKLTEVTQIHTSRRIQTQVQPRRPHINDHIHTNTNICHTHIQSQI